LFPVVAAQEFDRGACREFPCEMTDTHTLEFKRAVVEAHQELGALPGPAAGQFQKLAAALASELATEEKGSVV
jgi:hypothetical protein